MKFYFVSDDADACVGMRLAGVESVLVHDKADAAAALEKAADDAEIGILFVTGGIRRLCAEKVAALSAGTGGRGGNSGRNGNRKRPAARRHGGGLHPRSGRNKPITERSGSFGKANR